MKPSDLTVTSLQLLQITDGDLHLLDALADGVPALPADVVCDGWSNDGAEWRRYCRTHQWASHRDHRVSELDDCPHCALVNDPASVRGLLRYLELQRRLAGE